MLLLGGESFICWEAVSTFVGNCGIASTHDLALVFLLLRLRRRTLFFLHLALILSATASDVSNETASAG